MMRTSKAYRSSGGKTPGLYSPRPPRALPRDACNVCDACNVRDPCGGLAMLARPNAFTAVEVASVLSAAEELGLVVVPILQTLGLISHGQRLCACCMERLFEGRVSQ
jgi:hypothetical protein